MVFTEGDFVLGGEFGNETRREACKSFIGRCEDGDSGSGIVSVSLEFKVDLGGDKEGDKCVKLAGTFHDLGNIRGRGDRGRRRGGGNRCNCQGNMSRASFENLEKEENEEESHWKRRRNGGVVGGFGRRRLGRGRRFRERAARPTEAKGN